nr:leucine-rich repeat extensin-like protein 3 [Aegilops tauschii subsp. strangulata]
MPPLFPAPNVRTPAVSPFLLSSPCAPADLAFAARRGHPRPPLVRSRSPSPDPCSHASPRRPRPLTLHSRLPLRPTHCVARTHITARSPHSPTTPTLSLVPPPHSSRSGSRRSPIPRRLAPPPPAPIPSAARLRQRHRLLALTPDCTAPASPSPAPLSLAAPPPPDAGAHSWRCPAAAAAHGLDTPGLIAVVSPPRPRHPRRPEADVVARSPPSPDFLVPVAVVYLVLSLAGPPRATPPLFPAPNMRTPAVSPFLLSSPRAPADLAVAARRGHPRPPLVRSRSPSPDPCSHASPRRPRPLTLHSRLPLRPTHCVARTHITGCARPPFAPRQRPS